MDSKSLQILIHLLKSEVKCLRGAGAFGLSLLGPDAKPALQALSEALGHEKDAEVARAIVFALEDIGLEAAPGLVFGLNHPIPEVRDEAHEALASLALVYRESGQEVAELTQAFAEIAELQDLMTPLSEHLGLPPASPEELLAPVAGERDTFKAVARKRELGNALQATKPGRKRPH
jgi:HEAT repeat protein